LGWDINNEQGLAETYRHVVHEDALKIGRATKMPDYSFRVGGVRKFFVEAKKPAINLFKKTEPAYQVRRYGWNAKLSLSILTNFAEFAVYDCRIKPDKNDGASTARLFYIKYSDYQARWDELVALFSFEVLLKGKKAGPRGAASRLKILDPACGSGSFLLGAYQRLLNWHLEQYLQAPDKWVKGKKQRIYQSSGGSWKLTVDERKRILLNNIYGVDIDQQAVEVTKLSLLLKVLEDEQSVISQLSLFEKRVLPDLESNIKCGNSLIGDDFYAGQQLELLDHCH